MSLGTFGEDLPVHAAEPDQFRGFEGACRCRHRPSALVRRDGFASSGLGDGDMILCCRVCASITGPSPLLRPCCLAALVRQCHLAIPAWFTFIRFLSLCSAAWVTQCPATQCPATQFKHSGPRSTHHLLQRRRRICLVSPPTTQYHKVAVVAATFARCSTCFFHRARLHIHLSLLASLHPLPKLPRHASRNTSGHHPHTHTHARTLSFSPPPLCMTHRGRVLLAC